jgi:hypothetical protein
MVVSALRAATEQDQRDIFLFLRSLTAIRNKVPTPVEPTE